jgi:hypothetical protein
MRGITVIDYKDIAGINYNDLGEYGEPTMEIKLSDSWGGLSYFLSCNKVIMKKIHLSLVHLTYNTSLRT